MRKLDKLPYVICMISIIMIVLNIVHTKFGTYIVDPRHIIRTYFISIFLPTFNLLCPLFYGKNNIQGVVVWKSKNMTALIAVVVLSIVFLLIVYANQVYYKPEWIEQRWSWDNCPPIRWDFWSILF